MSKRASVLLMIPLILLSMSISPQAGSSTAIMGAHTKIEMVEKRDIADLKVLDEIAGKVGLGSDFSKKLRSGEKANEIQEALVMAQKYRINETPTLIIAGNIKTDPHAMNHDLDVFRINALAIIASILK